MAEIDKLLNRALELEHAAYLQYLTHAEVLRGRDSPGVVAQLRDNAADEAKHADQIRNLITNYLDKYPQIAIAETHRATEIDKAISVNQADELVAIEHYKKTLRYIESNPSMEFYDTLWETIRQILIEEEQHLVELRAMEG